jgi:hypothetical protein
MNLLERTYENLTQVQLTTTREAFSRDFVGKNLNWYAYQTYAGRDFSADAAIQCLRAVRSCLAREPTLTRKQRLALQIVEIDLKDHLSTNHFIADVCA